MKKIDKKVRANSMRIISKKNQKLIRLGIKLIPIYGVGIVLDEAITAIQKNRLEIFYKELLNNNFDNVEKILKSDDFINKYMATLRYVARTNQEEKIKMFANILKNSIDPNQIENIKEYDVYEDYIKILDDLTYREIVALSILSKYNKKTEDNELPWKPDSSDEFCIEIMNKLNINIEETVGYMNKISRTGCYISPAVYGGIGGGYLTPIFFKLQKYILENSEGITWTH